MEFLVGTACLQRCCRNFRAQPPSGVTEPSQADIRITERLKEALELVDIRLLDHLVVGSDVTSMAERGLL